MPAWTPQFQGTPYQGNPQYQGTPYQGNPQYQGTPYQGTPQFQGTPYQAGTPYQNGCYYPGGGYTSGGQWYPQVLCPLPAFCWTILAMRDGVLSLVTVRRRKGLPPLEVMGPLHPRTRPRGK